MACQGACVCTRSSAEMPSPEEAKGHVADSLALLLEALDRIKHRGEASGTTNGSAHQELQYVSRSRASSLNWQPLVHIFYHIFISGMHLSPDHRSSCF